jgi:hypothetical protein
MRITRERGADIRALRGILKRPGQRPVSVAEMNEAILLHHAMRVRQAIDAGLTDSEVGNVTPVDDVRKEFGLR